MNKITPITSEYLRPSRTIETIRLVEGNLEWMVYIYNYEGTHFRFFDSLIDLIQFFEVGKEPQISFSSEIELDLFLENFNSKTLS
jgi:hypothetical protein